MTKLNIDKTVILLGLLIAVLGGIGVAIPYSSLLLIAFGCAHGYHTASMFHVRAIVSALAITAFASSMAVIPEVGGYLEAIITNIGKIAQGSALFIIFHNMYLRMRSINLY